MTEVFPNYYNKFKCIADKCAHSCCIGWEIDIDESAMSKYRSLKTVFGDKIRKNIEGDVPHFALQKDERCPFLNEKGLCDIIIECGEGYLCDICAEHPRFRNFYSFFAETGLGLCCEEAARIILFEEERFSIALPENIELSEDEKDFFIKRNDIFSLLQNREKSIAERFLELAVKFGFEFKFSLEDICNEYLSLERLDDKWTEVLDKLKTFSFDGRIFEENEFQIPFEQLAVYFTFRHLSDALWDDSYGERVKFALKSCYLIGAIWSQYKCEHGDIEPATMVDFARMYSAEAEYSEDNLDELIYG
ncbi:MAG: flagellin lysine-N-methylase [Clostridia bacterium]|nr:flagellin lysine-N-methylase [Clostridia bacterium]